MEMATRVPRRSRTRVFAGNAPGRFDTDQLVAVESALDIKDRTGPGSAGHDDRQCERRPVRPGCNRNPPPDDGAGAGSYAQKGAMRPRSFDRHR